MIKQVIASEQSKAMRTEQSFFLGFPTVLAFNHQEQSGTSTDSKLGRPSSKFS
jgi:hypothetical protein